MTRLDGAGFRFHALCERRFRLRFLVRLGPHDFDFDTPRFLSAGGYDCDSECVTICTQVPNAKVEGACEGALWPATHNGDKAVLFA